jgi:L-alanine-DL-glutamate epimerase-like enolase superfamily enzyme
MKITAVRVLAMSDPVPPENRHRTDLGTKVKSDSAIIVIETDAGLSGMGAALGNPLVVRAIIEHELAHEIIGEDPMFSERIFEKLYNGSRAAPALASGWQQPDPSRRRGVIMEAIAGIDIAVWDVRAKALGVPIYQALGAALTNRSRRPPRPAGLSRVTRTPLGTRNAS